MTTALEDVDLKLLDAIQREVPLVLRPFRALAEQLGISESQVLERLGELQSKPRGVIRQISAIFDSRSLGYIGSLVASRVEEAGIEAAAHVINQHPGVSHNYRRNHAYNLWYTVTVPSDSKLGLEKTVQILHEQSGAIVTRLMPSLKLYKIGVKLNLTGESDPTARTEQGFFDSAKQEQASCFEVTSIDKSMIRVLQQNLPLVPEPFNEWSRQAGVSPEQLINAAKRYIDIGCMRRFSAVLRHREAGFGANAMGAWVVPPEQRDPFGATAASFEAVSHCYERPTYEDWPYSIFTMVHGQSPAECEQVLAAISRDTGINQYTALYSTHEFKKTRVRYFTGDIEAWEGSVAR